MINKAEYWESSPRQWVFIGGIAILVGAIFRDGLSVMVEWWKREEYSHGYLIPCIMGFLIWQSRNEISKYGFSGSWLGVALVLGGLLIYCVGELGTLYVVVQYGCLIVIVGMVLAVTGHEIFRKIWVPLLFLFFAIPLPNFIYNDLSSNLQLWSSRLGVSFIRVCDISVYLEGNVIDLGTMQLQVVEACSGLRYLFPLMSLAFICAYFYKVSFWKRSVVFLSSIPITIFMNSFRIGVVGITVEYFGQDAAEGFLHDFEGWVVFMACIAILLIEMWALVRLGKDSRPLQEVFGLTFPEPFPPGTEFRSRELPGQFWVVTAMLVSALVLSLSLEHRQEIIPQRREFQEFPMKIGDWTGQRRRMEQQYINALKFDDYILADYVRDLPPESQDARVGAPVNLYSAYYASQRKGESIHSPRSCIPGGGWAISSLGTRAISQVKLQGKLLRINRVMIAKGEERQLVYYAFQQRGRNLTNEYLVKWFLFWDALRRNRTDGALLRLTTPLLPGEEEERADHRLGDFTRTVVPELDRFIPH